MKRTFTLGLAFFLFLSFSYQSYASLCFARDSGDWDDSSIWVCYDEGTGEVIPGALPNAGDLIIIEGPHIVNYYETIDLSSGNNDKSTILVVNGELRNYSLGENCDNNSCNIDILLDEGSEVAVNAEDGLTSQGPNNGDKEVIIGGVVALNIFPFGPGFLPEDSPLPIKIISFEGQALDAENLITWETESEENTSMFLVERSSNGVDDFREVSRLDASGFSNTFQFYKTEDTSPFVSSYYRLKILYFDGSYEYSDVVVIERSAEIFKLDVYPIPTNEELNVLFDSKENGFATVSISTYIGTSIKNDEVNLQSGINRLNYNFSELDAGIYIISIKTGTEVISKTFLVNH
jgi:type IX secretion system substrate protein